MAGSRERLVAVGVVLLVVLAVPVTNLFTARAPIAVVGGPAALAKLSPMLQRKCVDCHVTELGRVPFYGRLPGVKGLIQRDRTRGVAAWQLAPEQLAGQQPLTDFQLAKLEWVVQRGEMPPPQYVALHWRSFVLPGDRASVAEYVAATRGTTPEAQRMAPARRLEPVQILLPAAGLRPDRVELGRALYHDRRLSGDGTVACASCHALHRGGTDQAPVSRGIRGQKGSVNAPTVLNASYNVLQFWDGRAPDLQAQAGGPVENPVEMGAKFPDVVKKLQAVPEYVDRFAKAYPNQGITKRTITDAIAEYERSLVTVGSPFDKYLMGDEGAIPDEARRGYAVFKSAGCVTCHLGPALGGRSFERFGVYGDYFAERGGVTEEDNGRFNVTHQESDRHRFKVPLLRNVADTHPYFHDATAKDLRQAVTVMARYQLEDGLREDQIALVVKFLESLTGTSPAPAAGTP